MRLMTSAGSDPGRGPGLTRKGYVMEMTAEREGSLIRRDERLVDLAESTRVLLVEVAQRGETINYKLLYDRLVEEFPHTPVPKGLWRHWIGELLELVTRMNRSFEEPILPSLVVQKATGEVSEGYAFAVESRYGRSVNAYISHARLERQKCYNFWSPTPWAGKA